MSEKLSGLERGQLTSAGIAHGSTQTLQYTVQGRSTSVFGLGQSPKHHLGGQRSYRNQTGGAQASYAAAIERLVVRTRLGDQGSG